MASLPAFPPRPTTRFAPSVTGLLHLGHVANAVWTWGAAQAAGGRVLLRFEDHDRGRWRPAFEPAILEDLEWLGLEPERASWDSVKQRPSRYRQSDNDARYRTALERLARVAPVFACECSRKTMVRAARGDAGETVNEDGEPRYAGTCRMKNLTPGRGVGCRVELADRAVSFTDLRLGPITQVPARQCGDLLLRDGTGNWTYQFGVVVDDQEHGVDLVVRGEDILSSTGRQLLLGELLGAPPPTFLHHPLVRGSDGIKLSKRHDAPSVAQLRAAGRRPADVLGEAAFATGLTQSVEPLSARELGQLFR